MVSDFRGWKGTRLWRTWDGDFSIEASHTGHHVVLVVSLSSDYGPDAWKVVVPAMVLPGEELRQLSADVDAFFREGLRR